MTLPVPRGFALHRAVCSYGYFLLAPNDWRPESRSMLRPLRDAAGEVEHVTIRQPAGKQVLELRCDQRVSRADATAIKRQVTRMLRIDEDQREWRRLHKIAARKGFDRMIRSPTLFEDIVKTITTTNITWRSTILMNQLLCEHVGGGGFPTAEQVARYGAARLKSRCKLGYRAPRVAELAKAIVKGRIDLAAFEDQSVSSDALYKQLLELPGVGPYAASNILMLLGHYDRLAIDTETFRHFRQVHGYDKPTTSVETRRQEQAMREHYAHFAPYQFKAYWFELWGAYEDRFEDATTWTQDIAGEFTASVLNDS